jgi:hypothetical protein
VDGTATHSRTGRSGFRPRCPIHCNPARKVISGYPERSDSKAMYLPSGETCGFHSPRLEEITLVAGPAGLVGLVSSSRQILVGKFTSRKKATPGRLKVRSGMSLTQVAKKHGILRASVCRLMKQIAMKRAPACRKRGSATFTLRICDRCRGFSRQNSHCSFAYSALACFRMGMSGSASFQKLRNSR